MKREARPRRHGAGNSIGGLVIALVALGGCSQPASSGAGGACYGGKCEILATGQQGPSQIAVDAGTAYWTNGGPPRTEVVLSHPRWLIDGGLVTRASGPEGSTVVAWGALYSDQDAPLGLITLDSTHVYWTTYGDSIMKVPIGGGVVTTLASGLIRLPGYPGSGGYPASGVGNLDYVTSLAVDANYVYWTSYGASDYPFDADGGSLNRVPLDGGPPLTLFSEIGNGGPLAIAVDSANAYWLSPGSGTSADNGNFAPSTGAVVAGPLDGGAATTLASGQSNPRAIAVVGSQVYWVNAVSSACSPSSGALADSSTGGCTSAEGKVMTVPVGGGVPTTLASSPHDPVLMAVDATSVYWATRTTMNGQVQGEVFKVARTGGTVARLASGQIWIAGLAVDSTSIYWTDWLSGTVVRHTPK